MNLILDGLYEQHSKYLNNTGAEKVIEKFARENSDSVKDLYIVTNIIKTSAICGYTYTKCLEEIRKKLYDTRMPNAIIAAAVKIMHDPRIKRNIYKEAAAYKYQIPQDLVTDEMMEAIKTFGRLGSGYSVEEPPVESWDEYYYNICAQIARNSKCLSRRIGALLVRDKRLVASGYNGPAVGMPRCDQRWQVDERFKAKYSCDGPTEGLCPRRAMGFKSGEGLEVCTAVHAEENAILMCARAGIEAKDTIMYMTCGVPCKECTNKIIQVGISEIVMTSLDVYDDTSLYLFENSNVKIRLFDFI